MSGNRDRGEAADPKKLASVLFVRFGSASPNRLVRRVDELRLLSNNPYAYPGRSSILRFCKGLPTEKPVREPLCGILGVEFAQVRRSSDNSSPESVLDMTSRLIEFPFVRTPPELFDVLNNQRYSHGTLTQLRSRLPEANDPQLLLNLGVSLVLELWKDHPQVAGLICILFGTNRESWHPNRKQLSQLEVLCKKALSSGYVDLIQLVEPLAFSLAKHGKPELHQRFLHLAIVNADWREANAIRTSGQYFGDHVSEISAIEDHLDNPYRDVGLLRAHDIPPLMYLMSLPNENLRRPLQRRNLRRLLVKSNDALRAYREYELSNRVTSFLTVSDAIDANESATDTIACNPPPKKFGSSRLSTPGM